MTDFTLSRPAKKSLPDTVKVNGRDFFIHSDFRTMLKIFRMLEDPDVLDIHKDTLLVKWFFEDEAPENWVEAFENFARCGEPPAPKKAAREFDYEFDAPEIYASFLQLYGIDLLEEKPMHWWRFQILLSGCMAMETPLSEKLRIRRLDVSKCADKAAAQAAKDRVQLPLNVK